MCAIWNEDGIYRLSEYLNNNKKVVNRGMHLYWLWCGQTYPWKDLHANQNPSFIVSLLLL